EQASAFFRDVPSIRQPAETLCELGLAYLKLGQPATSLSGGEAQRLKLARFLTQPSRRTRCPALLVLDEPTAGLHPHDVIRLLHVFRRLLDAGHTLCVVEHQLDVLRAADWIIELGPGAGPDGGRLIAAGPPAELRRHRSSSLAGLL
ncbi:MAG: ATP-binding cassette domain-containing protein, partial [Planctomycetota bacterium]